MIPQFVHRYIARARAGILYELSLPKESVSTKSTIRKNRRVFSREHCSGGCGWKSCSLIESTHSQYYVGATMESQDMGREKANHHRIPVKYNTAVHGKHRDRSWNSRNVLWTLFGHCSQMNMSLSHQKAAADHASKGPTGMWKVRTALKHVQKNKT